MNYKWILAVKYDQSQPRIPAGQSGGGRWTSGSGDYLSLIDSVLYPIDQRTIADALGTIPPEHLEGLTLVTVKAPFGYKYNAEGDMVTRSDGARVRGVYHKARKSIHLNMGLLRDEEQTTLTLAHEVGHHVARESSVWKRDLGYLVGELRTLSSSELGELGLRRYSTASSSEFLADAYTVWLFGSKSQWDGLNQTVVSGFGESHNLERLFGKKV